MAAEAGLALYHYQACGYCARVRALLQQLGIEIELRDILQDRSHLRDLVGATGRQTVPCLRIEGAEETQWMHESRDIVRYLGERFGA